MKFAVSAEMVVISTSLLSWERGLKYACGSGSNYSNVAPLVGAWIEIYNKVEYIIFYIVAPLVGAWIEIMSMSQSYENEYVAPLVGAWIEIDYLHRLIVAIHVAPLVGAWIEICKHIHNH